MSGGVIQKLMAARSASNGITLSDHEVDALMRVLTDGDTKQEVLNVASAGLADAWSAAMFDHNCEYELWIIVCVFSWLTLHAIAKRLGRRYGAPLSSRPTVIANSIHCVCSSVAASLLLAQDKDERFYWLWQRWVLPFSISYFIADGIWYCIPKRDLLISCHHITMIACHYPVGEPISAMICGAGNWKWAAWLSMVGYLAELSNPLLNIRWWLMQTLKEHHYSFSIVNSLVVLTFIGRIILFPYLIYNEILPRFWDFREHEQLVVFGMCVFGNVVICVMSIYWLVLLSRKGLKGILYLDSPAAGAGKNNDLIMGRDSKKKE